MTIIMIWIWSFVISSGPLFGFIGSFGDDRSRGFILVLAVGMPFIIIFSAAGLIMKDLKCLGSSENSNLDERQPSSQIVAYKIAIQLLAMMTSYLVFILPICIMQWVTCSPEVKVLLNTWHLLIYVINVIMFVFFDPRCREAICLLFKDIKTSICFYGSQSETSSIASNNEGDCTRMSTESYTLESFESKPN